MQSGGVGAAAAGDDSSGGAADEEGVVGDAGLWSRSTALTELDWAAETSGAQQCHMRSGKMMRKKSVDQCI